MTDMTLDEALSEIGKFGRLTKGFEKVAEVAQALQGAEQVITERTAAAAAIDAEIATATEQLAGLKADANKVKARAAKLVYDAESKAAGIVREAEDKARAFHSEAEAAVAVAQAELAQVRDDVASKRAQVIAAEADLADILQRTTHAREAARKLIGEG
jgi:cell division septum initiation protein DivIVA